MKTPKILFSISLWNGVIIKCAVLRNIRCGIDTFFGTINVVEENRTALWNQYTVVSAVNKESLVSYFRGRLWFYKDVCFYLYWLPLLNLNRSMSNTLKSYCNVWHTQEKHPFRRTCAICKSPCHARMSILPSTLCFDLSLFHVIRHHYSLWNQARCSRRSPHLPIPFSRCELSSVAF